MATIIKKGLTFNRRLESVTGTESGHLGSKCALVRKQAKLGEDYSLADLIALQLNAGFDYTPAPEDIGVFTIYYEDGMYRPLGVKLGYKCSNGNALLIGKKTRYFFTSVGGNK